MSDIESIAREAVEFSQFSVPYNSEAMLNTPGMCTEHAFPLEPSNSTSAEQAQIRQYVDAALECRR